MNKKNFIIGLIILIVIMLGGILLFSNNKNSGELIEVSFEEITDKVDNKDSFILVVSQSTCSHCATYKPKLMEITREYGINIYYINYDVEDKKVQTKFLDEFNLSGATPTTIFIKDGKEVSLLSRIEGDLPKTKVVTQIKKMGFIEE